jgi:hypothetical protein
MYVSIIIVTPLLETLVMSNMIISWSAVVAIL